MVKGKCINVFCGVIIEDILGKIVSLGIELKFSNWICRVLSVVNLIKWRCKS